MSSWLTMSEGERRKFNLDANVGDARRDLLVGSWERVSKKVRRADRELAVEACKVGASVWAGVGGMTWLVMSARWGMGAWRKVL